MNPDIFGYVATSLNVVMLVPQVFRTWKVKQTKELSLATLVIFLTASILWMIYGFMKQAAPIIIANIVVGTMNFILIILKLKYK